ncbi:type IV secretory system conjugative DNA transfer family protein [Rhizobium sp. TRM95111]|uniref:type IV secretory system conjugative DNA transfer family protein n=1 Tax=Rhizobium alarense TaxID=2846851 RepID=UPI001F40125C|nr:type IV secretory system conjugative DNA transfer family protein [Rhizobium alarense]MCF3643142.1 type IV secretory system conjugative DNA transfer family protein [Rhizobium alarense]
MSGSTWAKLIFVLVVLALATVGVVWLSGFVFFGLAKVNPMGKTDFATWWTYWKFYQDDPAIAKRLLIALGISATVVYGVIVAAVIGAMRQQRALHGEARFANDGEVARAGLFGEDGIIIGKWKKRFLMFPGMQFVLLAAPTRSGKGVGIVIPNLLNWRDSVVVLDVKQENFLITSGYRAHYGQECYLFNPFAADGTTHRYNPLGYISDDAKQRVTEILAIGYSLYPGEGRDAFFDDAARNLFLGLTLYLCETPELPRTIGELLRQSSGKGMPVKDYIQSLVTQRNFREVEETDEESGELVKVLKPITQWDGKGLPPLSMECVDALNRFTSTSDNTLSSIMATFNVPLTLWASPIFDAATAANDFDLRDVRKRRMSIYLGIPANKLAEARLVLNLFFSQLVNLNTDQLLYATPELKYQCLMLMDEFTAPGRIGIIDKSNSYMAGYGLRLLTIIQSPGQLESDAPRGYGRESARTLVTNHACQLLYTPREQRDANEYSEMLGYQTVHARNRSRSYGGRGGGSTSESQGEGAGQKRALMLPQELKEMSQRLQIINLENTKPIQCTKIAYYEDRVFLDRLKEVSPSLRKLGSKRPSKSQLEAAWGSGELASAVPPLDFDLHEAVVHARMRDATPADVAEGVDLKKLALDTSKLTALASDEGISAEEAEAYVSEFFGALEASAGDYEGEEVEDDGSSEAISDDEMAALDAAAAAEDEDAADDDNAPGGDSGLPVAGDEAAENSIVADEADADSLDDEDLAALFDDMPDTSDFPDDDEIGPDDGEELPQHLAAKEPLLDLSILDKPADQ